MNCSDFREMISAALDGELTADESRLLAEHLKSCPECARLAETLGELEKMVAQWPLEALSPEMTAKIIEEARSVTGRPKRSKAVLSGYYRIPRLAALSAAILIIFLAVQAVWAPVKFPPGEANRTTSANDKKAVRKIVLTENDIVESYTTTNVTKPL